MKINRYLGLCLFGLLIASCGGSNSSETKDNDTSATVSPLLENENANLKGKELITQSDCLGCHKEQAKLVGPAYKDVALKYEKTPENITLLAKKIIKGGQGIWGQVPMTPHPQISQTDAEEMVKYILSLK